MSASTGGGDTPTPGWERGGGGGVAGGGGVISAFTSLGGGALPALHLCTHHHWGAYLSDRCEHSEKYHN